MKISLKNFRCYEEKSFEIPDKGLIQLEGQSGAGKSSLLQAFLFALFGKTKNPYRHGTRSCSVTLEFDTLKITRVTPNKKVLVERKGKVYDGDEAESHIENYIRMNYSEFLASSVVIQNMDSSVLSMTPLEQTKFVETFAFKEKDSEEIKQKIKDRIKELEKQKDKLEAQCQVLEDQTKDIGSKRVTKPSSDVSFLKKEIDDLKEELDKKKQLLTKVSKDIPRLRQDFKKEIQHQEKVSSLTIEVRNLDTSLRQLEAKVPSEEDLSKLEDEVKKEELSQELYLKFQTISKEQERFNDLCSSHFQELSARIDELKKNLVSAKTTDQLAQIELQLKVWQNQEIYQKFRALVDKTTLKITYPSEFESIVNTKFCYSCPSCKTKLSLIDHKLIKHEGKEIGNKKLEQFIAEFNEIFSEIYPSELDAETFPEESEDVLQEKYEELTSLVEAGKSNERELSQKKEELESKKLPSLLIKLQQSIDSLRTSSKIPKNYKPPSSSVISSFGEKKQKLSLIYQTKSEILLVTQKLETKKKELKATSVKSSPIKEQLEKAEKDQEDLVGEVSEIESKISSMKDDLLLTEKYERYLEMKKKKEEAKSLRDKITEIENELRGFSSLEELAKKAELLAFEKVIDSINSHAKTYLDHMFTDPIIVRLENEKQTKTRGVKLQMNVFVQYRGLVYSSIDQLSGGTRRRCILAFLLVTKDIMNSRFLLLDECLNNLDSDTNSEILNYLKDLCSSKCVLVISHEAVQGVFDHVIHI